LRKFFFFCANSQYQQNKNGFSYFTHFQFFRMKTKNLDKQDKVYLKLKYTMSRFLLRNGLKKWEEIDIENIEEFSKFYIENKANLLISKNLTLKGYVVGQFIHTLLKVIEAETNNFIPKIYVSRIKRTIKRFARPILAKNPQVKNRAKCFKHKEIREVISTLFCYNEKITDIAAISLSLCFTTGARLADVINIFAKDMKLVTNNLGKFLKINLRNSKNNLLGIKSEQLTFKIDSKNILKTNEHLILYLSRHPNPPEKLIELEGSRESKIKKITYQYRKISKKLGLKNQLSAHSGRNSVLLELCKTNIDEESKKIFMRWTANSLMPTHYRGMLLECSAEGAAEKLNRNNFNMDSE
jgi:hypothetical protein